jgi:phosphoribosylformylglycinamidine cyclo-ligase
MDKKRKPETHAADHRHTQDDDAYAKAGVNIEAGNRLVDRIKPFAKATTRTGVMGGIGGFGALFDVKALNMRDPLLVSTTDGVGTKLKLAQETGIHSTIGIDLVAMCVNDLIVQGATPLFFLDYFATGALNVDAAAEVIQGIAEGCAQAGCALVGGETAEMPGMYHHGEYDLAGFSVGAVERDALLPKRTIAAGDVLLALASSGAHSNGYSLIRKIVADGEFSLKEPAPFVSPAADGTRPDLGEVLLTPTRIYVKSVLAALATGHIKAMAHITGGGITENLPRVLPETLACHIDTTSWTLPPLFQWLRQKASLSLPILRRTFNCGLGMILVVEKSEADSITQQLTAAGETVYQIGTLKKRTDKAVVYSDSIA